MKIDYHITIKTHNEKFSKGFKIFQVLVGINLDWDITVLYVSNQNIECIFELQNYECVQLLVCNKYIYKCMVRLYIRNE